MSKDDAAQLQPVAFVANLAEQQPTPHIPIRNASFAIGRATDNDLCLADDKNASRHHCVIHVSGTSLALEDCGSSNGTCVNGRQIRSTVPLPLPSWIMVGRTRLAIIPPKLGDDQLATLIESTYSSQGSILVPPSSFFQGRTEAFLVVDLVASSQLVQKDDVYLAKVVSVLGRMLERALRREREPFLKCTGDGFLACFGSAEAAMEAATQLGRGLARHIPQPLQVSIALHWGSGYLTAEGDRTGKDVHTVFSLEELRRREKKLKEALHSKKVDTLLLMTEAFWSELSLGRQAETKPLGFYRLKGLDEKTRTFRWYDPLPTG